MVAAHTMVELLAWLEEGGEEQREELCEAFLGWKGKRLREAIADVGRALQKDVLEARNALESARVEAVKSRTDYQLAWVELRRLQGVLTGP